jgi:hypothetical protein
MPRQYLYDLDGKIPTRAMQMFKPSVGGRFSWALPDPVLAIASGFSVVVGAPVEYWSVDVVAHTLPVILWVLAGAVEALTWCVCPGISAVASSCESSPPASPRG